MTAAPVRLQLSRKRGFDLQAVSMAANGLRAVKVCRPSEFGNPFRVSHVGETIAAATAVMGRNSGQWWVETDASVWRFATRAEAHDAAVTLFLEWFGRPQNERLRERARLALRRMNLACWCPPEFSCHATPLLEHANT